MRTRVNLQEREDCQAGVAIVEFAVVVPLFLFLLLAGMEYSRIFERYQWVSQLSREAANLSLRECSAKPNPMLRACLDERVVEPLRRQAVLLAPGTEYVIAVFDYNEGAQVVTRREIIGNATFIAKFTASGFGVEELQLQAQNQEAGTPGNALRELKTIVVAGAYSPIRSVVGRVIPGFNYLFPDTAAATMVL